MTGGHLKKRIHFRCDDCPLLPQAANGWVARVHTGGAEHHIRRQIIQVIFSHPQMTARLLQRQHLRIQLLPGRLVAAGNIAAEFQQQPH